MSRIIPVTLNKLSMAEAFLFYRDELKLHVYPVYGPWSKEDCPGKKSAVTKWWDYDPYNCNLAKFFGDNGKCHNIGCAPKNHLIVVDLDSKEDKGESVRKFLTDNPDCAKGPWHETNGGAHLVFICPDLPKFWRPDGKKPLYGPLKAEVGPGVNGELFYSDHTNVVFPPSIHVQGSVYRWVTFGEVPEVSWKWLQDVFKFSFGGRTEEPKEKHEKDPFWYLNFRGNLKTLDILAMLEALGHPTELIDAEENKYSILCPWHEEHSENGKTGSSTVVWQRPDRWPKFKCLHAHCTERGLETLLTWAEGKQAGIVDRFCEKSRVYDPAAIDEKGRPQVLHPGMGRLITEVYEELIAAIRPAYTWFKRSIEIVTINKIPSGFIYSGNEDTEYKVKAHITGFCNLNAQDAKSRVEKHVIPGKLVGDGRGNVEFRAASFSTDFCNGLVSASEFRNGLPEILRILTVPIPIRVGNRLVFPCTGYDPRFGTFLIPDAPILEEMPLDEALKILESIHAEFPFTNEQSRTHALARLLTPFARGLLGWTTGAAVVLFRQSPKGREGLSRRCALLVYEGYAFEDLPIGRDSEETRKRLIAAARSGRRFMHFSNCQGYLQDSNFYQVITATGISARNLGAHGSLE